MDTTGAPAKPPRLTQDDPSATTMFAPGETSSPDLEDEGPWVAAQAPGGGGAPPGPALARGRKDHATGPRDPGSPSSLEDEPWLAATNPEYRSALQYNQQSLGFQHTEVRNSVWNQEVIVETHSPPKSSAFQGATGGNSSQQSEPEISPTLAGGGSKGNPFHVGTMNPFKTGMGNPQVTFSEPPIPTTEGFHQANDEASRRKPHPPPEGFSAPSPQPSEAVSSPGRNPQSPGRIPAPRGSSTSEGGRTLWQIFWNEEEEEPVVSMVDISNVEEEEINTGEL